VKQVLKLFTKVTDFIFLLLDGFCRALILFMTLIVFAQVILRGVFKMNIPWAEETVLLAMVWLTFAAMAIGVKEEVHIRIEFFTARLPKSARRWIVIFGNVVLLLVNVLMVYYGLLLIKITGISRLPVTKLQSSAVFYLIPVSAAVSSLALLGKLCGRYRTKSKTNFIEGVYEMESLTGEGDET
jgi:TRAP-type C4-dicarboxylate transport system permease small subunit